MESVFENLFSAVSWAAASANLLLGTFLSVQAALDRQRRWPFAAFAFFWWIQLGISLFRSYLPASGYDLICSSCAAGLAGSLLWLLGGTLRQSVSLGLGIQAAAFGSWLLAAPGISLAIAYSISFGVMAALHGREFVKNRGYASCLLFALSLASALLNAFHFLAVKSANPDVLLLGYSHFVLLSVLGVFFGWVHLPRELRGKASVRVRPSHGWTFVGGVAICEAAVICGQLWWHRSPPVIYLAGTFALVAWTLLFFFHHRHQLVIYADNVTNLLEQRTGSLREAREKLALQNEIQAAKLAEQEAELRAKAEVIERQRRVELAAQTAGQVAHDIQNLLSPLDVYLRRLQNEVDDPEKARTTLQRMRRQLAQLFDINSQLLTLSRRGRLEFHPVRLAELMEELAAAFPERRVVVAKDADAWILGAWSQLSRAGFNLIQNAAEAQPDPAFPIEIHVGKSRVVKTRRCHLGFLQAGEYSWIEIRDRGPGIPEEVKEKIFEPFFSSKHRTERSGSGLGLSIVTAVVDDHGGVIDLETGANGTAFTLFFPAIEAPTLEAPAKASPGGESILLVDDEESVRERCRRILESAGYAVTLARDGREALQILQSKHFDLLVADLKMPQISGAELAFGAMHLQSGIRIVVHSSHVEPDQLQELQPFGIAAALLKPTRPQDLLRTVREVLDAPLMGKTAQENGRHSPAGKP